MLCYRFPQTNNVGKLNLDEIDGHDTHLTTTFQLSNLRQLKVEYTYVNYNKRMSFIFRLRITKPFFLRAY